MMKLSLFLLASSTLAFPLLPDGSFDFPRHIKREDALAMAERFKNQPLNKRAAEPYSPKYPYTSAKIDGLPGTQIGGQQVPDPNDQAHQYQDPPAGAQRGPCPGLNAAANHGFLSRDGRTTFNELVAAQQNVYNLGYDVAIVLATAGVGLDGNIVTGELSINMPTSAGPGLMTHNKFEADTSLSRADYYLNGGDDYSFQGTLFGEMVAACGNNFNRECLSTYRKTRWNESQKNNPNFYFGPGSLLLYGAATFLYELMPTNGGQPDLATIASFFGAKKSGNGWTHVPERIPDNWFSRKDAYTGPEILTEIATMYAENPVLFGGNFGKSNFVGLNYSSTIVNGKFSPQNAKDVGCILQQALLNGVPGLLDPTTATSPARIAYMENKLSGSLFSQIGCPAV